MEVNILLLTDIQFTFSSVYPQVRTTSHQNIGEKNVADSHLSLLLCIPVFSFLVKTSTESDVVAHTFNTHIWEAKGGGSL